MILESVIDRIYIIAHYGSILYHRITRREYIIFIRNTLLLCEGETSSQDICSEIYSFLESKGRENIYTSFPFLQEQEVSIRYLKQFLRDVEYTLVHIRLGNVTRFIKAKGSVENEEIEERYGMNRTRSAMTVHTLYILGLIDCANFPGPYAYIE